MRAFSLALALSACGDGKSSGTVPDDGGPTDTDPGPTDGPTTDTDDTDTVPSSPYGLDARPPNPTCVAPARPLDGAQAQLTRVFAGVTHTNGTMLLQAPGDPDHWYLTEKAGRVWRFDDDPAVATRAEVLDLTGPVSAPAIENEKGLLGMAFHPDFQANGELFLYYTADTSAPGMDSEIHVSRVTSTDGGLTFGDEEVLLVVPKPYWNHNGGTVAFGPDGYLYLGTGDGGSAGDPGDRAQDPDELLGKVLRLDVDVGVPYAIPPDNPYAGGGGRGEIYAIGLRNPFRFSFDPASGDLWLGDVGQNAWEEVDRIERGGNYGWNVREGYDCYSPAVGCASAGLSPPYAVYANNFGASVVGGVVYRGTAIPGLQGVFLYNDYQYGDILGVFFDPATGLPEAREVVPNTNQNLVHYTYGDDGEVYLLTHSNGRFYRLDPLPGQPADPFPQRLSETGCFEPADPWRPVPAMIPYAVGHPFWSDGADKHRWLAIPDGQTISVGADGDWELPIGSVLAKHFERDGQRIETRLYVRHDDGDWAGYSYAWDGADATLVAGAVTVDAGGDWAIPDRGECARCHTPVAGGSLGLETMQLNGDLVYESTGRRANQLATLDHVGMFAQPPGDPAALGAYPAPDDTSASLEDRARAYLHVNCSQCHRPDGPSRTDIDFRYPTALVDTNACGVAGVHGDLGIAGAQIIAPGDPASSLVSSRMRRRDAYQMPPVASSAVDEAGADLVDEWIGSLSGCP